MSMLSPVAGFLPRRTARVVVEKAPNPAKVTVPLLARASAMAENTAVTAAVASAFESDAAAATRIGGERPNQGDG